MKKPKIVTLQGVDWILVSYDPGSFRHSEIYSGSAYFTVDGKVYCIGPGQWEFGQELFSIAISQAAYMKEFGTEGYLALYGEKHL